MPPLYLIELAKEPIFSQLQLEEALLRADKRSFCIMNFGSPRAIVMGLSNSASSLLHLELVRKENIPVIKRFSGGGTVIVDEHTLFVTFIFSKETLSIPFFPEPMLKWGEEFYQKAWQRSNFLLRENDYCIDHLKCGGNAQYVQKERFLQHTSFLWDYSASNMEYLQLPERRPKYRLDRDHNSFLTRLKSYGSIENHIEGIKKELSKRFTLLPFDLSSWRPQEHRQATHLVSM